MPLSKARLECVSSRTWPRVPLGEGPASLGFEPCVAAYHALFFGEVVIPGFDEERARAARAVVEAAREVAHVHAGVRRAVHEYGDTARGLLRVGRQRA